MIDGGSSQRSGVARLALFGVLAALTRVPFLTVPFLDLDEAAALVGSWTLLDGGTLYVDFVDNRPPLLYHLYALGQILFGRGMLAVRLLTVVVVLPLTAFAASAFFRHDRRGLVTQAASALDDLREAVQLGLVGGPGIDDDKTPSPRHPRVRM